MLRKNLKRLFSEQMDPPGTARGAAAGGKNILGPRRLCPSWSTPTPRSREREIPRRTGVVWRPQRGTSVPPRVGYPFRKACSVDPKPARRPAGGDTSRWRDAGRNDLSPNTVWLTAARGRIAIEIRPPHFDANCNSSDSARRSVRSRSESGLFAMLSSAILRQCSRSSAATAKRMWTAARSATAA